MSELRENIDQALRTIVPGEPPVEEAMRRGKTIRIRRRVAAAAGAVAVIVGVVIGYPALAHRQALPAPATNRVRVTVNPPDPHSPAGLIASGLIGTQTWQFIIENPGARNQNCFDATGSAVGQGGTACEPPASQLGDSATPIGFQGTLDRGKAQVLWGLVLPEVSYATARLADGTVLTLHPVSAYGMLRYVAFAVPSGVGVASVTAYSSSGEIATAIPFNYPGGLTSVVAWLRPGQSGQARFTATIASGTTDGHAWRATAYVGPWGTCVEDAVLNGNDGYCYPDASARGTSLLAGGAGFYLGSAVASVSYVTVDLKDGSTMRVAVTAVGPQKFFAFGLDKGQSAKRWTAYDAAGKPVASGVFKF